MGGSCNRSFANDQHYARPGCIGIVCKVSSDKQKSKTHLMPACKIQVPINKNSHRVCRGHYRRRWQRASGYAGGRRCGGEVNIVILTNALEQCLPIVHIQQIVRKGDLSHAWCCRCWSWRWRTSVLSGLCASAGKERAAAARIG